MYLLSYLCCNHFNLTYMWVFKLEIVLEIQKEKKDYKSSVRLENLLNKIVCFCITSSFQAHQCFASNNCECLAANFWNNLHRHGKLYWFQLLVFALAFSTILLLPRMPAKNSYAYALPLRFELADFAHFHQHFHPEFHYDSKTFNLLLCFLLFRV